MVLVVLTIAIFSDQFSKSDEIALNIDASKEVNWRAGVDWGIGMAILALLLVAICVCLNFAQYRLESIAQSRGIELDNMDGSTVPRQQFDNTNNTSEERGRLRFL